MTGRRRSSRGGGSSRPAVPVKLRAAKGRKPSSQRWLRRQLSDPYVREARRQGYRSRSAFKLTELDDRFRLLRPGARIVDLGAAPGGWTQVAVRRVGTADGKGLVVAVDMADMDPVPGARVLVADIHDPETTARVRTALGGPVDVVLSDMAPSTTGHPGTDHLRIVALAEAALALALEVLAPGGAFVCKVFQGGAETTLLSEVKRRFAVVRHAKPRASRGESSEMYVVAAGFRSG